jgi:deazaflavin-dependent oxidoreductase (nitroreductase family)
MSYAGEKAPRLPPRWFVRLAWYVHRGLYRISRGRVGLWRAKPSRWGTLRLTTIGRRTNQERSVILGYLEDGPNVVTLAMNGWAEGEPAWWLNLQPHPNARIDLSDGPRSVKARAAAGAERSRLWAKWREAGPDLDAYAALRSSETAVVILEPQDEPVRQDRPISAPSACGRCRGTVVSRPGNRPRGRSRGPDQGGAALRPQGLSCIPRCRRR